MKMKKKRIEYTQKQLEYTEAIIYIFAVITAICAYTYGNIYFSFVPLLVILGVVGSALFKRSIVTTVFGVIVSLCLIYTKGELSLSENIRLSLVYGLNIALGESLGYFLKEVYNVLKFKEKEVKKLKKNKVINTRLKLYLVTFAIFILTVFVFLFTNGNMYSYNLAKDKLYEYIKSRDNIKNEDITQNYIVVDSWYDFGLDSSYNFDLLNKENDLITNFVVYNDKDKIVLDRYNDYKSEKNNNELKEKLLDYLSNNNLKNKYKDLILNVENLDNNKIKILIKKQVKQLSNSEKESFAKEISKFLNDISMYAYANNLEQVEITLKSIKNNNDEVISSIMYERYLSEKNSTHNSYKYILDSLVVEYME